MAGIEAGLAGEGIIAEANLGCCLGPLLDIVRARVVIRPKILRLSYSAHTSHLGGRWPMSGETRPDNRGLVRDRQQRPTAVVGAGAGLMTHIAAAGDDTIGALAERAGLDPSTSSRNRRGLEREGLVEIAIVEKDLRRRAVWLTEAGAAAGGGDAGLAAGAGGARRGDRPARRQEDCGGDGRACGRGALMAAIRLPLNAVLPT